MKHQCTSAASRFLPRTLVLLTSLAALGACHDGGARATGAQAVNVPSYSVLVPWGAGDGEAGRRLTQPEYPGDGPSALAGLPGDNVLVLDRLHGRVLAASQKGARTLAAVPKDSEDLAAGPDGTFVTHSLLRSRAFVFDRGAPAGEVAIDRVLRELTTISLGAARRVLVSNAFQETFPIGSASLPQKLDQVLHGKKKGAFLLADGTGVQTRVDANGKPELLLVDNAAARARVRAVFPLGERALSARVVGAVGDLACARLEEGLHGTAVSVTRRAVCLDLRTGQKVFEQSLGAPGAYLPRRELAMSASPTRLLFMRPEEKGLRIYSWTLGTAEVAR